MKLRERLISLISAWYASLTHRQQAPGRQKLILALQLGWGGDRPAKLGGALEFAKQAYDMRRTRWRNPIRCLLQTPCMYMYTYSGLNAWRNRKAVPPWHLWYITCNDWRAAFAFK